MRPNRLIVAAAPGGLLATTAVVAQGSGTWRVRITYRNLTAGQAFSPSVFMAHSAAAPKLFAPGAKASLGLAQLAEGDNVAPIADMAGKMKGRAVDAYEECEDDGRHGVGRRVRAEKREAAVSGRVHGYTGPIPKPAS